MMVIITSPNATNGTTSDNFWSVASTQTKTQRDTNKLITFASTTYAGGIDLDEISVGVFTQALRELSHSSCRQWRYNVKFTVCI